MKKHKCDTELITPLEMECSKDVESQIKRVYFNLKTKEVRDELKNLIGFGEIVDGKLKINYSDGNKNKY